MEIFLFPMVPSILSQLPTKEIAPPVGAKVIREETWGEVSLGSLSEEGRTWRGQLIF
jgi:hypothetical protein